MKTWTVRAESIVTYETQIQANTQEEAWQKAKMMDGSEFDCLDECDWKVYDVFEEDLCE